MIAGMVMFRAVDESGIAGSNPALRTISVLDGVDLTTNLYTAGKILQRIHRNATK